MCDGIAKRVVALGFLVALRRIHRYGSRAQDHLYQTDTRGFLQSDLLDVIPIALGSNLQLMGACRQVSLPGDRAARLAVDEELRARYVRFNPNGHTEGVELGVHVAIATGPHRARASDLAETRRAHDDRVGSKLGRLNGDRWIAVVLAIDRHRRFGNIGAHQNARNVGARCREPNRDDTLTSSDDGDWLLHGFVAGRPSHDTVLAGRQRAFGRRGYADVDPVEANDRARHVGDYAQAAQLGSHANRRVHRGPLVGLDGHNPQEWLVALARASDLDLVIALRQTVDD